jgi:hypothetical protein
MKKVQERLKKFEQKYKTHFETFEKELPPQGDYTLHEDYGEWAYLHERAEALAQDIADFEQVYGSL